MSVWQTPQPTTSMITSSGESSPRAVSAQSNWPLTTNLRPLLVAGVEQALCAGRGVVIGSLLTHNSNERSKTMCQGTLVGEIEDVIAITSCCDLMAESVLPKMRADIWLLRYLARLGQSFSSFSCSAFWYAALCSGVIWGSEPSGLSWAGAAAGACATAETLHKRTHNISLLPYETPDSSTLLFSKA